jgi:hypothetical protein
LSDHGRLPDRPRLYHYEVNYNEGWNVYNAQNVARHVPLYPRQYGWTTVNYPALSFHVVAYLSRFTHSYLLTGRLLSLVSLLASCAFVGLVIKNRTRDTAAAFFGAFFCLALFCMEAPGFVGADDPQMFAQIFFLGGFLLYLSAPPTLACIGATAFLFALSGNIKHNLLDFALAAFIDLWIVSRRKAFQFLLFSAVLVAISVVTTSKVDGAFFLSNMLSLRSYSLVDVLRDFALYYGPILLPFLDAFIWAVKAQGDPSSRPLSLLFLFHSLLGCYSPVAPEFRSTPTSAIFSRSR